MVTVHIHQGGLGAVQSFREGDDIGDEQSLHCPSAKWQVCDIVHYLYVKTDRVTCVNISNDMLRHLHGTEMSLKPDRVGLKPAIQHCIMIATTPNSCALADIMMTDKKCDMPETQKWLAINIPRYFKKSPVLIEYICQEWHLCHLLADIVYNRMIRRCLSINKTEKMPPFYRKNMQPLWDVICVRTFYWTAEPQYDNKAGGRMSSWWVCVAAEPQEVGVLWSHQSISWNSNVYSVIPLILAALSLQNTGFSAPNNLNDTTTDVKLDTRTRRKAAWSIWYLSARNRLTLRSPVRVRDYDKPVRQWSRWWCITIYHWRE